MKSFISNITYSNVCGIFLFLSHGRFNLPFRIIAHRFRGVHKHLLSSILSKLMSTHVAQRGCRDQPGQRSPRITNSGTCICFTYNNRALTKNMTYGTQKSICRCLYIEIYVNCKCRIVFWTTIYRFGRFNI